MMTVPQLEMLTGIGAMKSFSVDVKDWPDERLFRLAAPKCTHELRGKMFAAVRLIPASPNVDETVLGSPVLLSKTVVPVRVLGAPGAFRSMTSCPLTEPSATPVDVRS